MTAFGTISSASAGPGGELGGTWLVPTVDTTHSGSSHASLPAPGGGSGWTTGSVVYADSSGNLAEDNASLFYDPATDLFTAGNMTMGFVFGSVDLHGIAHADCANTTDYALLQGGSGNAGTYGTVFINAKTGKSINFRINNADQMALTAGTLTISNAVNIAVNTSTGTKIGTGTTQKLGFWNAAPVAQQANTVGIDALLTTVGFRASGGTSAPFASKIYPPTDAGALQTAAGIYAGTGAPNNANGANGDFYFNSAGGALTTVYQKRVGAWVGLI